MPKKKKKNVRKADYGSPAQKRHAAKWRLAGMKANLEQYLGEFHTTLHEDERDALNHILYDLSDRLNRW